MASRHPTKTEFRTISHDENYTVSNTGEVFNDQRGKKLTPYLTAGGYQRVDLPSGRYYVHKLVAEAFHGPAPHGHVATHRDRDVAHNHADNIKWATKSEIISEAWARKRSTAHSEATVNG